LPEGNYNSVKAVTYALVLNKMASMVWVRRKTNLCEVCNRVMELGEDYKGRCSHCGSDFCENCAHENGICTKCSNSSLFQASLLAMG
jgi:hypothetical protein